MTRYSENAITRLRTAATTPATDDYSLHEISLESGDLGLHVFADRRLDAGDSVFVSSGRRIEVFVKSVPEPGNVSTRLLEAKRDQLVGRVEAPDGERVGLFNSLTEGVARLVEKVADGLAGLIKAGRDLVRSAEWGASSV